MLALYRVLASIISEQSDTFVSCSQRTWRSWLPAHWSIHAWTMPTLHCSACRRLTFFVFNRFKTLLHVWLLGRPHTSQQGLLALSNNYAGCQSSDELSTIS